MGGSRKSQHGPRLSNLVSGRGRALLIAAAAGTLIASAFVAVSQPATGKQFTATNRFAPSGIVTVDPLSTPPIPAAVQTAVVSGVKSGGCFDVGDNVRANQDCTNQSLLFGRSQAQNETAAAVNPTDPANIVVGQNDYSRGDGNCGVDWSVNGGKRWGSRTLPMAFTAPGFAAPRHYWNAGGDPSLVFDSTGEAYYMCGVFDRGPGVVDNGDFASALLLFRSPDGGASWSFPGSPVIASDGTGNDGIGLLDKQYMTIDGSASSPFQDRIYVSWTQYNPDFSASPIAFAYSDDHGVTWHQSGLISGTSADLCPINFSGASAGTCDADQFSEPFVAPNGDVYVVFQNFNNCSGSLGAPCTGDPNDNHNQILIVKSTDGGTTFGTPVKVADFYDLPDCATYTGFDFGRGCVPTAPLSGTSIFRAENYPSGVAVSNTQIEIDFGSYINRHSNPKLGNCAPAGISADTFLNLFAGVGDVGGCNNDILQSVSTDGGATFTGTTTDVAKLPAISKESQSGPFADQWWQWSAPTPDGKVAVAYYDRKYADDQSTGFMDITMTSGGEPKRVTSASMPPSNEFPDSNGFSLFMGDYMGIAVGTDGKVHPVWTDTRNTGFTFDEAGDVRTPIPFGQDEDIYTASLGSGG